MIANLAENVFRFDDKHKSQIGGCCTTYDIATIDRSELQHIIYASTQIPKLVLAA